MTVSFKQFRCEAIIDAYMIKLSDLCLVTSKESEELRYLLLENSGKNSSSKNHKIQTKQLFETLVNNAKSAKANYIQSFRSPRTPSNAIKQSTTNLQVLEQNRRRAIANKERLATYKVILLSTIPIVLLLALAAAAFLFYIAFILIMPLGGAQLITSIAFITAACILIPSIALVSYYLIKKEYQTLMGQEQSKINLINAQIEIEQGLLARAREENSIINNNTIENYDYVINHGKILIKEFDFEFRERGISEEDEKHYADNRIGFFSLELVANENNVHTNAENHVPGLV